MTFSWLPQRPGSPRIRAGRDGFLFLVGGSNRPLASYRPSLRRWRALRGWEALIRDRQRRAKTLGCRYLHLVVPEKLTVYPEKVPELGIDPAGSPAQLLARRFAGDPDMVDLLPLLAAAKARTEIYRRTDSHWTFAGCLLAHDALCRELGVEAASGLDDRPFYESRQAGDLGRQVEPPQSETVRHHAVHRDARRVFAGALVAHYEAAGRREDLHRGAHVVFRNEAPSAAATTLVLFGDSCAHFEPFLLTGMLAETFREVHFVWSAGIDWAYVGRVRPDAVIGEVAERFLRRLPRDDFDVEAFGAARLAEVGGGPASRS